MEKDYWQGQRVLVTGASGFIGSHLVELLVEKEAKVTATVPLYPSRTNHENLQNVRGKITVIETDLTRINDCLRACEKQEVVINAAHVDGSVAFKGSQPAFIFRENMLITLNMLEAASKRKVDRLLVMSSAEVYSPDTEVPTPETEGFVGLPSQLTDGYAWSKRMSEFAGEVFARERGLKVAIARPSNIYGPRDHFDVRKGRVIPMFIEKAFQEKGSIVIWGSGEQVRSFLYVEDLVRGLLNLIVMYPTGEPVNFSSIQEITIRDLAELIVELSGRKVKIVCDPEKPYGPMRRLPDTLKAKQLLGFSETFPLKEGLQRTIDHYRKK